MNRGRSRQLLIVDDDEDFAISTSRALSLEGINCRIACDGATARKLIGELGVEVALLDIRLLEEDGAELAAKLRAQYPSLIIVIMTAYASVDSAVAALKAGVYDYLRKPFFLDELMQALDRCFQLADLRRDKLRAEQQLALLGQIEAASQLATGLSHDFRNMLAVVTANLAAIDEWLPPSDRLKPYATDALEAADAATGLVSKLVDFARNSERRVQPIDLRRPVSAAIEMLQRSLCASMQLQLQVPDQPLIAPANPAQIEASVVNLLINARDATEGQGQAKIRLMPVWRGGHYARLRIEDNGPGLSPEDLRRAVDPRFTTKADGTGLGLAMIHHLALISGGDFRIENHSAGGARAILDLPALAPDQVSGENM